MTFQKGQSGNPGGRAKVKMPDGRTLSEIAREATPQAVAALLKILESGESEAAIVSAATAIMNRGWGLPRQDIGIEMKSDEAMASLLEAARRRAFGKDLLPSV